MDEITSSNLDMMLAMPVTIVSKNRERKMFRNNPCARDWLESSYTVRLQFQNVTIETDIQENDTRYELIKEHLERKGIQL